MSSKSLIEGIARGAERLIADNRRLRAEVARLEGSRDRLREEYRRLLVEKAELARRVEVRDLVAGFSGDGSSHSSSSVARTRVSRLIRDIDRCVAILNRAPVAEPTEK